MDLFSTNYLAGVVKDLRTTPQHFLDTEFRTELRDPSEEIHFDLDERKPRLTPYVSPLIAGKVVEDRGFVTKTFKPPYLKDKRRFDASRPLKRAIGERIGGELSPDQRLQLMVGMTLEDQVEMLKYRMEVQAAEALRLGQVTVSGEGFKTAVVSFGRHTDLRAVKTGTARWSQTESDPLSQIETMANAMMAQGGAVLRRVTFAPDAYQAFRTRLLARDEWKLLVDYRRASTSSTFDLAPGNGEKARYLGTIGTVDYYVYDDLYIDPVDATEKHLMPSGEVVLTADEVEGTRCFAAIRDEDAGFQAVPYFPKSWKEPDPAVRWMLMQSAALMVPFRPNASASMEVLNGGS
ncbi:MAG: major capsid protein [Gemmatimonadaceae bacterium]|nr:major capsid protein [Gemmatimonadaceae bacterium]